jgi:hypothetical protein
MNESLVIVRGSGGVPRKLVGGERVGRRIVVYSLDGHHDISLPDVDVFDFDEAAFTELCAAYLAGDATWLANTWKTCRQFTPPPESPSP